MQLYHLRQLQLDDNMGCNIMTHLLVLSPVQSPPKGVTIPYRPKPSGSPVIFAGGQVHTTLEMSDMRIPLVCLLCLCYIWGIFIAAVVFHLGSSESRMYILQEKVFFEILMCDGKS